MNRTLRDRLRAGLLLGVFAAVSGVWLSQAGQQENPFTGTSFRIDSEGIRLSSRGFEAGARTHWHRHSAQLLFVKEGRAALSDRGPAGGRGRPERNRVPAPGHSALARRGAQPGADARLGHLPERRRRALRHRVAGPGRRRGVRERRHALTPRRADRPASGRAYFRMAYS